MTVANVAEFLTQFSDAVAVRKLTPVSEQLGDTFASRFVFGGALNMSWWPVVAHGL
jgi:hypothetical protein